MACGKPQTIEGKIISWRWNLGKKKKKQIRKKNKRFSFRFEKHFDSIKCVICGTVKFKCVIQTTWGKHSGATSLFFIVTFVIEDAGRTQIPLYSQYAYGTQLSHRREMKNIDCCKVFFFFLSFNLSAMTRSQLLKLSFVVAVKDCGWCSPLRERTEDTQLCLRWWQAVSESCLLCHHVLDILRKTKQLLVPHRSLSECISSQPW